MGFFEALGQYEFVRNALLTGVLASLACGVVGTYVVTRRITYLADGIAHCVFGGLGLAHYLRVVHQWDWLQPLHGALAAALLAALVLGLVSVYAKEREDTIISALWATGMAVGVIFIVRTPGYTQDLMSYLFGNILMVSRHDLWLLAGLDVVILLACLACYPQLQALCFDEEFARLRGVRVRAYYFLLLCLTALTVVVLATVVGIVLVIALLALPVAVATRWAGTLGRVMLLAVLLSAALTVAGLVLSFPLDLPAGAVTIVLAGAVYLTVTGAAALRRRGR